MEAKLKHLEFIQAAIGRMATNSFLFKGWAITIAAGLSAFGAANTKTALLAIAVVSTAMFWATDAYYLWLERCFRDLYDEVRVKKEADIDFSMNIAKYKTDAVRKWFVICRRHHLLIFYGTIIVIELIGICVIRSK